MSEDIKSHNNQMNGYTLATNNGRWNHLIEIKRIKIKQYLGLNLMKDVQ